jgi:hypothetical protein
MSMNSAHWVQDAEDTSDHGDAMQASPIRRVALILEPCSSSLNGSVYADLVTHESVVAVGGLSATGSGGFLLLLIMNLSGSEVNEAVLEKDGIGFKAQIVVTVDEIPSAGRDVNGKTNILNSVIRSICTAEDALS